MPLDIETKKKIIKDSGKFFLILNLLIFIVVIAIVIIKLFNS